MRDQLGGILDPVEEAAEPEQRLQVAQAALALLDVGLEQITAVAGALVPGIALGELRLDEDPAAAGHHLAREARLELVEDRALAPQEARFEEARADLQIVPGEAHAVVDRAGRLTDLEPEVPESVEQELDHLLGVRGALVGIEEQQVDIGIGCQLGAAVAADRRHRQPLARGRIGHPEHPPLREVEQAVDQRVDHAAAPEDHRFGVVVDLELAPQAGVVLLQPALEAAQQHGLIADLLGRQQRLDLGGKRGRLEARRGLRHRPRLNDLDRQGHAVSVSGAGQGGRVRSPLFIRATAVARPVDCRAACWDPVVICRAPRDLAAESRYLTFEGGGAR